ncbi:reticulon B11 [Olea europaea subsp. europaea]|uniref:Reticulon-like protein n=1 Tax=Olea europaea subsp. europaea TaxID=158383 RepID=A0A8S0VC96_OLEEU|nr:reticulon B11 [Olea europaea subsp. europaea]
MRESRRFSVHLALGSVAVADVLLWEKWWECFSALAILFFWAKSASLLNRLLLPLRNLEVSEEIIIKAADEMRVWVNYALSIARDIAIGGNLRLFIQVALCSCYISFIGNFFNFLTLLYIGQVPKSN